MSTTLIFGSPVSMDRGVWAIKFGLNIAKNVPEGKSAQVTPSGLRVYIEGSLPYAGFLAQQINSMPLITTPFDVLSQWTVIPDDAVPANANALECDDMYNAPDGSVGNLSFEITQAGHCQIVDAAGNWQDIGFNPGMPPPNVPTLCSVAAHVDPVAKLTYMKTIKVGNQTGQVPASMQGIPFFALGWAKVSQMVKQVQPSVPAGGGAFSFEIQAMTTTVTW